MPSNPSFLSPLLEVLDLDVAADAARNRSATLPERESLPLLDQALVAIDARIAAARAECAERHAEEEQVGQEVVQVARAIEAAEVERYSGKRKNQDEAATHDEAQKKSHEKQIELEEREMELLETVEAVERQIEDEESIRAKNRSDAEQFEQAIQKVDAEVVLELERLASSRSTISKAIPEKLLAAYERIRSQSQTGGRGAAPLTDGRCGGCRIKLPSLEKTRMLAEPEDALIQCPQCRRLLVR
jgi:predicted  nucleic acid-binding Zn-ribbon protein